MAVSYRTRSNPQAPNVRQSRISIKISAIKYPYESKISPTAVFIRATASACRDRRIPILNYK